ncbi:MAG: ribosome maturation factor RimP [Dethiobacteria bacterium]
MGNKIKKVIEALALRVTGDFGYELVDLEYKVIKGEPHVVLFIDKPGGILLEDCEQVSKSLGELLDIEDPIPSSYLLEVSSCGVERPLKKAEDYKRFQGENVKLKTFQKINGRKNFIGILSAFNGEEVILQTEEEEEVPIKLSNIAKANLYLK